jgi:hypothetical protein
MVKQSGNIIGIRARRSHKQGDSEVKNEINKLLNATQKVVKNRP